MSGYVSGGGRKVGIIDVSVRDGHQSLWATRMRNATILGAIDLMDTLGFKYIDLEGGAVFDVCVRYLKEDPWERMRLISQLCKRTPLQVHTRGQSLWTFELFPDEVVELSVRRSYANGMRHIFAYDCINDVRNLEISIRVGLQLGMSVSAGLVYSLSPVHTDEHYVERAKRLMALGVDSVCIKDPSGLLKPERVRTLIPSLRAALTDCKLELHTHSRSGLAPACLLEGVELGVDDIHTAVRPLSHGASHTPTDWIVYHLEKKGYRTGMDQAGLQKMADYFTWIAERDGMPLGGRQAEYDPFLYEHQTPGGQISNLINQLRELGIEQRLDQVMDEMARVRVDFGYPPVVSPMAQYVATQAVLNVLHGERYRVIPIEIRNYLMGYYGQPPGAIDPNLLDRVAGSEEPFTGRAGERLQPVLAKTTRERGPFESEDDLLLAVFYSDDICNSLFDARARAGGRYEEPNGRTPIAYLLKQLAERRSVRSFDLEMNGLRVQMAR